MRIDVRNPQSVSGWRVIELLWPLNDLFRPRLHEIGPLPYDPAYEPAADAALNTLVEPSPAPWRNLPPPVWRVLLERQLQAIETAGLHHIQTDGAPFTMLPRGLSEADLSTFAAVLLLHGMKLPLPPADRSAHEFPPVPPGKGWQ